MHVRALRAACRRPLRISHLPFRALSSSAAVPPAPPSSARSAFQAGAPSAGPSAAQSQRPENEEEFVDDGQEMFEDPRAAILDAALKHVEREGCVTAV